MNTWAAFIASLATPAARRHERTRRRERAPAAVEPDLLHPRAPEAIDLADALVPAELSDPQEQA